MKKYFLLFPVFFLWTPCSAVTLSYNLKVRRAFNVDAVLKQQKPRWLATAVPIYYSRTSHIVDDAPVLHVCEERDVIGSLFNVRYVPSRSWWFEGTTGIERDHGNYRGTQKFENSRIGIDDIVLAGGYRMFLGKDGQLVGYGLIGIPATTEITACDRFGPFVGSRIYNVGAGAEISYSLLNSLPRSLAFIAQGRIIHGFTRSWFPILPEGSQIQPGNITDILLTVQYREGLTIMEAGYNATIFSNQAVILPTTKRTTKDFLRTSWYATLSRASLKSFFEKPFVYGVGVNVSNTDRFDAKTFTGWMYFTFVF